MEGWELAGIWMYFENETDRISWKIGCRGEKREGVRDDYKVFGLRDWKDKVAIHWDGEDNKVLEGRPGIQLSGHWPYYNKRRDLKVVSGLKGKFCQTAFFFFFLSLISSPLFKSLN